MSEIEKLEKRKEKFMAVIDMAKNLSESLFDLQIETVKNQPIPDYKKGCNNVDCGIVKDNECKCEYYKLKKLREPLKVKECDNCKKIKENEDFNKNSVFVKHSDFEFTEKCGCKYMASIIGNHLKLKECDGCRQNSIEKENNTKIDIMSYDFKSKTITLNNNFGLYPFSFEKADILEKMLKDGKIKTIGEFKKYF